MALDLPPALSWVFELIGCSWPDVDEDRLAAFSERVGAVAPSVRNAAAHMSGTITAVSQTGSGPALGAFTQNMRSVASDGLPQIATGITGIADEIRSQAVSVEYSKGSAIVNMAIMAPMIAEFIAAAPETFGASLVAAEAAVAALRASVGRILLDMLEKAAVSTAMATAGDLAVQGYQILVKHDRSSLDGNLTLQAVESGAIGGAIDGVFTGVAQKTVPGWFKAARADVSAPEKLVWSPPSWATATQQMANNTVTDLAMDGIEHQPVDAGSLGTGLLAGGFAGALHRSPVARRTSEPDPTGDGSATFEPLVTASDTPRTTDDAPHAGPAHIDTGERTARGTGDDSTGADSTADRSAGPDATTGSALRRTTAVPTGPAPVTGHIAGADSPHITTAESAPPVTTTPYSTTVSAAPTAGPQAAPLHTSAPAAPVTTGPAAAPAHTVVTGPVTGPETPAAAPPPHDAATPPPAAHIAADTTAAHTPLPPTPPPHTLPDTGTQAARPTDHTSSGPSPFGTTHHGPAPERTPAAESGTPAPVWATSVPPAAPRRSTHTNGDGPASAAWRPTGTGEKGSRSADGPEPFRPRVKTRSERQTPTDPQEQALFEHFRDRLKRTVVRPNPDAGQLRETIGDFLKGIAPEGREPWIRRTRDLIDTLPEGEFTDVSVNTAHKALDSHDHNRPTMTVPGADYVSASHVHSGPGQGYVNRDIPESVVIDGEPHVPVYSAVFSDALGSDRPIFKDIGQDDSGVIQIHTGADGTDEKVLWVSFGQPLRQLKWVENYAQRTTEPMIRSFLVPLRTVNEISRDSVTEHNSGKDQLDLNVDKHFASNQFGIRRPESLELLRRTALPGSLRTYTDGTVRDRPDSWGDVRPLAQLRERLGVPDHTLVDFPVFTESGGFLAPSKYESTAQALREVVAAHRSNPELLERGDRTLSRRDVENFFHRHAPQHLKEDINDRNGMSAAVDTFVRDYVAPWASHARITQALHHEFDDLTRSNPTTAPVDYRLTEAPSALRGRRRTTERLIGQEHAGHLAERFAVRRGYESLGALITDVFTSDSPHEVRRQLNALKGMRTRILEDYPFKIGERSTLPAKNTEYRQAAAHVREQITTALAGRPPGDHVQRVLDALTRIENATQPGQVTDPHDHRSGTPDANGTETPVGHTLAGPGVSPKAPTASVSDRPPHESLPVAPPFRPAEHPGWAVARDAAMPRTVRSSWVDPVSRPSGDGAHAPRYQVSAAYDVRSFTVGGRPVTDLTVKVHLRGDRSAPSDVDALWDRTRSGAERVFNESAHLLDDDSVLHVTLERVGAGEADAHLGVTVVGPDTETNQHQWRIDATEQDLAHELGHQLGLRDEYRDATAEHRPEIDGSLMGNYHNAAPENLSQGGLRPRYLQLIHTQISAHEHARTPGTGKVGDPSATARTRAVSPAAPRRATVRYPEWDRGNRVFKDAAAKIANPPVPLNETAYLEHVNGSVAEHRPLAFVVNTMVAYTDLDRIDEVLTSITGGFDLKQKGDRVAFVVGVNAPHAEAEKLKAAIDKAHQQIAKRKQPVAFVASTFTGKFPYGAMRNDVLHSDATKALVRSLMDRPFHPYISIQDFDTASRTVPSGAHVFDHFERRLEGSQDEELEPIRPLMMTGGYRVPHDQPGRQVLIDHILSRLEKGSDGEPIVPTGFALAEREEFLDELDRLIRAEMAERAKLADIHPLLPYAPEPNLFVDGAATLLYTGDGSDLVFGEQSAEFATLAQRLNKLNAWEVVRNRQPDLDGAAEGDHPVARSRTPTTEQVDLPRDRTEIIEQIRIDAENNRLPRRGAAFFTDFVDGATVTDLSRLAHVLLTKRKLRQSGIKLVMNRLFTSRPAQKGLSVAPYRDNYRPGDLDMYRNHEMLRPAGPTPDLAKLTRLPEAEADKLGKEGAHILNTAVSTTVEIGQKTAPEPKVVAGIAPAHTALATQAIALMGPASRLGRLLGVFKFSLDYAGTGGRLLHTVALARASERPGTKLSDEALHEEVIDLRRRTVDWALDNSPKNRHNRTIITTAAAERDVTPEEFFRAFVRGDALSDAPTYELVVRTIASALGEPVTLTDGPAVRIFQPFDKSRANARLQADRNSVRRKKVPGGTAASPTTRAGRKRKAGAAVPDTMPTNKKQRPRSGR